jgi:CRISPR-associated protein Csb2
MPLLIEQSFPLGRFHATRWNQSPFEDPFGEWPPSPWRFLRALAARSFQYERETGAPIAARDRLLNALAKSPPSFYLPPSSERGPALRQYQPTAVAWTDASKKKAAYMTPKTTLMADHYRVVPGDDPVVWIWSDLELDTSCLALLDALLDRTLYFGRAESFCRMRRVEEAGIEANCVLRTTDSGGDSPVLVPIPGSDLRMDILLEWTDGKLLAGHPIPPGTEWHFALLPRPIHGHGAIRPPLRSAPGGIHAIQFAVGGRVYPPMAHWIRVAERFRGRVIQHCAARLNGHPRVHYDSLSGAHKDTLALLTGKDATGTALKGGHPHAYFLLRPDVDGNPTRLIVWRQGTPFTTVEIEAMIEATERSVAWENGAPDWQLRLVPLPDSTPLPSGFRGPSRVWRSVTPFVPPAGRRRFRENGRLRAGESVERIAERLLEASGWPTPARVVEVPAEPVWVRLHETRERRFDRLQNRTPLTRPGYRLEIEFEAPVTGPIMIGDSSHFGLGQFASAE